MCLAAERHGGGAASGQRSPAAYGALISWTGHSTPAPQPVVVRAPRLDWGRSTVPLAANRSRMDGTWSGNGGRGIGKTERVETTAGNPGGERMAGETFAVVSSLRWANQRRGDRSRAMKRAAKRGHPPGRRHRGKRQAWKPPSHKVQTYYSRNRAGGRHCQRSLNSTRFTSSKKGGLGDSDRAMSRGQWPGGPDSKGRSQGATTERWRWAMAPGQ